MKSYFYIIKEFFLHYIHYFYEIWKIRKTLDTPKKEENEYDFLPAHLELVERPVSALPHWAARLIMFFVFIALIWSILGKVDIVATASGKLNYSGHSKIIQPIENAIVKGIYVKEGQLVKEGELLLELVSLGTEEELKKANQMLISSQLTKARAEALLSSISTQKTPHLSFNNSNISELEKTQAEQLITAQFNAFILQIQKAQSLLEQKKAEYFTTQTQKEKYQAILNLENEKFSDYTKLYKLKDISKHQYLEQKSKCIEIKNEILALESKLNEVNAEIHQAENEITLIINTSRRDTQEALRQADEQIKQLTFEQEKYEKRQNTTKIHSPVTGTIQQLAIHTLGGVVTAAQPLMVVVPQQDKLEVNALISNKDIGFIHAGQEVSIKIEAFPYTQYGYITGKVKSVSFDAIEQEKIGLMFSTIIEIDKDYLLIENRKIHLSAGMNINAEIKTGKRRIISYLLSPLQSGIEESFKER